MNRCIIIPYIWLVSQNGPTKSGLFMMSQVHPVEFGVSQIFLLKIAHGFSFFTEVKIVSCIMRINGEEYQTRVEIGAFL